MSKSASQKILQFQNEADIRRDAIHKEFGLVGGHLPGVRDESIEYTHLGGSIYVPADKAEDYRIRIEQFCREEEERFRKTVTMDEFISYELGNHEAYYTWTVDTAMEAVKGYYPEVTEDDMWRVFNLNKHKYE